MLALRSQRIECFRHLVETVFPHADVTTFELLESGTEELLPKTYVLVAQHEVTGTPLHSGSCLLFVGPEEELKMAARSFTSLRARLPARDEVEKLIGNSALIREE